MVVVGDCSCWLLFSADWLLLLLVVVVLSLLSCCRHRWLLLVAFVVAVIGVADPTSIHGSARDSDLTATQLGRYRWLAYFLLFSADQWWFPTILDKFQFCFFLFSMLLGGPPVIWLLFPAC